MSKNLVWLAVAGCLALVTHANVSYSLNGGTLSVTAPSTFEGKSLRLLWNKTDGGDESDVTSWTNSAVIVSCVPSTGGAFSVNLDACGITNGQPCRIATYVRYNMLDTLKTQSDAYVETGVKDSDIYGIRFGFYGDECPENSWGCFIGTRRVDDDGGFALSMSSTSYTKWCWWWQGTKMSNRPTVSTTAINEIAFTNGVFSVNGTKFTAVSSGSIGSTGRFFRIGKGVPDQTLYGYFSHVSFDGEDGNRILDYVPVQRTSDSKVGFWDCVGETFVPSSGTNNFIAGTMTGEFREEFQIVQSVTPNRALDVSVVRSTLTVVVPAGLGGERLCLLWDVEDKGDDPAAWANSSVIAEQIAAGGGTYTVRLDRLGVVNGNAVRVVAANCYQACDYVTTQQGAYVDSGVKDSDVYGVRFGFCGDECSASDWGGFFGTRRVDNDGGFSLSMSGTSYTQWCWWWQGTKKSNRPTVSATEINEIAFTNGVFSVNGTKFTSVSSGSVGTSGRSIRIGKGYWDYVLYGKFSHVSFDNEDGRRILDYIPARRVSDGKAGFYDRATSTFVASGGTGDFGAGPVTDDATVVIVNSQRALTVTTIPGFIILFQ